jgi:hypothetical protein
MPQLVRHSNGENTFEICLLQKHQHTEERLQSSGVTPTLRKNFAGEPSAFSVSIRAVWDQSDFP